MLIVAFINVMLTFVMQSDVMLCQVQIFQKMEYLGMHSRPSLPLVLSKTTVQQRQPLKWHKWCKWYRPAIVYYFAVTVENDFILY
jgi:hypothetical protein